MKVLFLDVDGVLNSMKWIREFPDKARRMFTANADSNLDIEAVKLLDEICKKTGAKIVLSSTWRKCMSLTEFRECMTRHGFTGDVIGVTPNFAKNGWSERGHEIQEWLDEHVGWSVDHFAIVDDDSDMIHLKDRLVQTSTETGLTRAEADKLIEKLNG